MYYDTRTKSAIINFLLSHRLLRTHVRRGERFLEKEQDLAGKFLGAPPSFKTDIDEYLAETGFRVIACESSEYVGIPTGGTHFLLIRDTEENVPPWLSAKNIYGQIALAESEPKATTRLWFFFIWSNMLALLYSVKSRPISNVSGYLSANFSQQALLHQVRNNLEEVRQNIPGDMVAEFAMEKGNEIERRINKTLRFLENINYLVMEKEGEETYYSQSLIMALELKENYHKGLGYRFDEMKGAGANIKENFFQEDEDGFVN